MSVQMSESTEMYLKAMVELSHGDKVAVGRLAERLGVTNVSANEMVHRLTDQGLVAHIPYKGVALTEIGQTAACSVLRRQRLWECFLYEHLKIEWAKLYELACALEHATAPEVTEALAVYLGDPKFCPRVIPSLLRRVCLCHWTVFRFGMCRLAQRCELLQSMPPKPRSTGTCRTARFCPGKP